MFSTEGLLRAPSEKPALARMAVGCASSLSSCSRTASSGAALLYCVTWLKREFLKSAMCLLDSNRVQISTCIIRKSYRIRPQSVQTYKSTVARRIEGDLSDSLAHSHVFPSARPERSVTASAEEDLIFR